MNHPYRTRYKATIPRVIQILKHSIFMGGMISATTMAAPVSMTASANYRQDFNTLPSSGTDLLWADDSTLAAWYSQRTGNGTTLAADKGTATTGNLYSYGNLGDTDRALGSIGSGTNTAGSFAHGLLLKNDSSSPMQIDEISYIGEQWRNSGVTTAQEITISYQISSSPPTILTPGSDTQWTALPDASFASIVNSSPGSLLDGNLPANRNHITTHPQIQVPAGSFLMVRWSDPDHAGNDHGLAIDDVAISWSPSTQKTLTLSVLPLSFLESNGNNSATGTVSISSALSQDLTITLVNGDNGEILIPASVTIPAGQTSVAFPIGAVDDRIIDGTQWVTISAQAVDYTTGTAQIEVLDAGLPATLAPGDIMVTGFNADGDDDLAFVTLVPLTATDGLFLTDSAWNGQPLGNGGAFAASEGVLNWSPPAEGLPAGSVVILSRISLNTRTASTGTLTLASGSLNLGSEGETIYFYQGTATRPSGFVTAFSTGTMDSIEGTGLTREQIISIPTQADIAAYIGVRSGQSSWTDYSALLRSAVNWRVEDGSGSQAENGTVPDLPFDDSPFSFIPTENSYTAWIASYSLGLKANFGDDPDADGLPNALENVLGGDPTLPDVGISMVSSDGSSVTFRHSRADHPAVDLIANYEWSPNLTEWYASGTGPAGDSVMTFGAPTVVVDGSPNDLVEISAIISGSPLRAVFVRLKVSTP